MWRGLKDAEGGGGVKITRRSWHWLAFLRGASYGHLLSRLKAGTVILLLFLKNVLRPTKNYEFLFTKIAKSFFFFQSKSIWFCFKSKWWFSWVFFGCITLANVLGIWLTLMKYKNLNNFKKSCWWNPLKSVLTEELVYLQIIFNYFLHQDHQKV